MSVRQPYPVSASGASIGGAITGGTAGSVLFVNPDNIIAQDNANFFYDDTLNTLALGTNVDTFDYGGFLTIGSRITAVGEDVFAGPVQGAFTARQHSDSTWGGTNIFVKSRGTLANPTIVASEDLLGQQYHFGWDGGDYKLVASYGTRVVAGTTPGAGSIATEHWWAASQDGASSPTEQMVYRNNGGSGLLTITGTIVANNLPLTGTYTPTRSNEINLDANVTMSVAQYIKTSEYITVSGRFTANPTTTATLTSFEIDMPALVSNFTTIEQVGGTAVCGEIAGMCAAIKARVGYTVAVIYWMASDIAEQSWAYHFTCKVTP